jgi:hypothetical protein
MSAHPTSCFKGLINGKIFRNWTQNTPENFIALLSKFIERLVQCGHLITVLTPLHYYNKQRQNSKSSIHKNMTEQEEAPSSSIGHMTLKGKIKTMCKDYV